MSAWEEWFDGLAFALRGHGNPQTPQPFMAETFGPDPMSVAFPVAELVMPMASAWAEDE